jgi:hypothetical protein
MKTTNKAKAIMKLLKQGYSPREVTKRMDASYNYAWKLKKQLEAAAAATVEEAMRPIKETILSVANTVYPEAGEYVVVEGAKSVQEIDAILNTRATTYGTFKDVAGFAQEMKNAIRMCNNSELDDDQIEALDMIASKIARIVNGDPNHTDSWIDIAGYATLVADRLQGKTR